MTADGGLANLFEGAMINGRDWRQAFMSKDKDISEIARKAADAALENRRSVDAAIGKIDHLTASVKAQEMNASISNMIEQSHALTLSPSVQQAIDSIRSVRLDPAVSDLAKEMNKHQEAMRLALEPFASIKQSLVFDEIERISAQFSEMTRITEQFQQRFRMPELGETARLAAQIQERMRIDFEPLRLHTDAISEAMKGIQTPWLDAIDAMRSAQSFAALQGIGKTLAQFPAFGDEVTFSLRDHLGDWREPLELSAEIANDIFARSTLYESRGFNPELTEFPAPAFEDAMDLAELSEPVPDIVIVPDLIIPAPSASDEPGYERTNRAHNRLLRFEAHMRKFIEGQMRSAFGENWIKHRVPGDIRKAWLEKQVKAREHGDDPLPLFEYADFTDYEIIIVKRDNWAAVFEAVFRHKESVAESLRRLYPIRLSTMHARLISQDDELYLLAEVKRLLKAIGVL